ncbi:hypothetical protein OBBRIDRAFT_724203 [Obba rivulosa]|uniref:Matrin-type domain-containing protein n=1 Tax=Obba rivulosa TaxID=1052685 RepID=A0A8E2DQ61_9APHY|nr:hypothetical protein OBBRIDRAFT_724203 [Obba rivulosa]
MSEYWVSHKKYFCKYCNIYIADDVPSRRQHEGGLRHKGNVERFVRGLYKAGEKKKQDLDEEKREMARVEQAAQAAFARDVGAGLVKPGSSSTVPVASSSTAPKKPSNPSDPYADYSTAQSLGFTDPDAERLKAEAERRQMQGVAGEWEIVGIVEPSPSGTEEAPLQEAAPPAETSRKREAEPELDDEDTRRFKLRKKTASVGLGEIYDPGIIPIKLKKEERADSTPPPVPGSSRGTFASFSNPTGTERPKWSARGWKKPGEAAAEDATPSQEGTSEPDARLPQLKVEEVDKPKQEELPETAPVPPMDGKQEVPNVKTEEPPVKLEADVQTTPPPSGSLFRKRKLPAGGAGSRGRRS